MPKTMITLMKKKIIGTAELRPNLRKIKETYPFKLDGLLKRI